MLQALTIRNFAIIEDLHISFSNGLTMLTGETGAGKSIIINAVNLLLGGRASAGLIRASAETAELEAHFLVTPQSRAAEAMSTYDIDSTEGLFIRRIISQNEKHRVYINGRLATTLMLGAVTESLASISGQHAHQGLLKEETHLQLLDRFDGLIPLRQQVSSCYREMLPLLDKLHRLGHLRDKRRDEITLFKFQKTEIETAAPVSGEDEALEKERSRLKHSEMLFQTVQAGIQRLYGGQGAAAEQISAVCKELSRVSQIDPGLIPINTALTDLTYQVEDVAETLRSYADRVLVDEGRLDAVTERLDVLNKLKRKYGGTLSAVLTHLAHVTSDLAVVESVADEIANTRALLDKMHLTVCELVRSLSQKRGDAAKRFSEAVKKQLSDLKMDNTSFEVILRNVPVGKSTDPYLMVDGAVLDETGIDRAAFMIAPNVGEAVKPLSKTASGGELSRVVLALMAILSESDSVGLVVFDEVDAGIGGVVAEMVGKKIKYLSQHRQVLCITHLAQIAKFSDHHYRISKQVSNGRTTTTLLPLDYDDRVREIARMLGGETITQATLNHARELLNT